jgi:prepilin-type N-terminal cleavage/methylation domain-containing protein/prepilin-type processing-associated H-X9-DG protein
MMPENPTSPSLTRREAGQPNAFTLIELLVVVLIIAILAALLLPALGKSKLAAQNSNCQSNLKQMMLACFQYVDDNQGNIFPAYDTNIYTSLWIDELNVYSANVDKIRLCPVCIKPPAFNGTNNSAGACDQPWVWNVALDQLDTGCYCINGWLYSGDSSQIAQYRYDVPTNEAIAAIFLNQTDITTPSKTPYLQDSVWVDFWPWPSDEPCTNLYTANGAANPPGLRRAAIPRHGGVLASQATQNFDITTILPGAINLTFADGHVEGSPLEHLWSYSWNKTWVVPVPRPGL